jgi:hypothetical protein
MLDPTHRTTDRGVQRVTFAAAIAPGTEVEVATRPGPAGDRAFDWAYWQKIELQE